MFISRKFNRNGVEIVGKSEFSASKLARLVCTVPETVLFIKFDG